MAILMMKIEMPLISGGPFSHEQAKMLQEIGFINNIGLITPAPGTFQPGFFY
jgi:hypothetical protein